MPGWLTAHKVSMLLGQDSHKLIGWVKTGIFPGISANTAAGTITLINFEQLKVWITRPEHWMYVDVKRMKPGYLRRLVEKAQERWGDEWLSTRQAAELVGLKESKQILVDIKVNKLLPALHCPHLGGRDKASWSMWFVRKSDLMNYVHPQQTDCRVDWCTPRAEAFMWRMHLAGKNSPEISRMMKRSGAEKFVCYRIAKMKRVYDRVQGIEE